MFLFLMAATPAPLRLMIILCKALNLQSKGIFTRIQLESSLFTFLVRETTLVKYPARCHELPEGGDRVEQGAGSKPYHKHAQIIKMSK